MITGTFQPDNAPKKWKKFYGDFIMDDDGTIFLPYVFAGCSSIEVFLCASYDGQPVVQLDKNAFYRADWLKENFPKMGSPIDRAVLAIKKAQAKKIGPFSEESTSENL